MNMQPIIETNREGITRLCQRYKVARLEVFGSAVTDQFDASHSDVDFLVEFLPLAEGEHAPAYFGLLSELEKLLGRPVDLVMTKAIRNRYFMQSVNRSRMMLYAA